MHLENTADALLVVGTHVFDVGPCIDFTRIHTEEAKATHKRIGCNLECKGCKWFVRIRLASFYFVGIRIDTRDSLHVERRRKVFHNRVEHGLNTFVFECRTTKYRSNLHGNNSFANGPSQLLASDASGIVKELLHKIVVEFCNGFHKFLAVLVNNIY